MKKLKTSLIVLSLIAYACGGADESQEIPLDTTTSTSTTVVKSLGNVYENKLIQFDDVSFNVSEVVKNSPNKVPITKNKFRLSLLGLNNFILLIIIFPVSQFFYCTNS